MSRRDATIEQFGAQWSRYPENEGYYASLAMLADICEPLLPIARLRDRTVVEIGSGSGRIVNLLLDAGAARVVAVEPSAAMDALERNVRARRDRVELVRARGEEAPVVGADFVLSIGVLHHIVDPAPVVRRAFEILAPGGECLIWLYGAEGNEAYLEIFGPLRRITTRIPDALLAGASHLLAAALGPYIRLARRFPVPMRDYAVNVLGKLDHAARFLVVFDQLNPQHAKYYRRDEAVALLSDAGFEDVRVHHRHGYSWTVIGRKP